MAEKTPTLGEQDGGQDGPEEGQSQEGGEGELGTRPAGDAEDAGRESDAVLLDPAEVEEETEAERNLEDITNKLRDLQNRISLDSDAAQNKLRRTDAEINRLYTTIGKTEMEGDEACFAHGLASGYINGIRHAISTLRSNDASSPTTILRKLIEEQKGAALALATRLVGDELAESLVADREILLGSAPHTAVTKIFQKAQGLIWEFRVLDDAVGKQEGVVRIAGLNAALSPDKSKVAEAEITLATLCGKKAEIETDAKSLLTQLVAALRVSAVLKTSMGSADSAAATLEGQLSELTTAEAASLSTYTSINERLSDERVSLEEARPGKITAERAIDLLQDQLAGIDDLMRRLSSVLATLNAAKPLVAGAAKGGDLYEMIGRIGRDLKEYEDSVSEPINRSGTVVVKPDVHTILTVAGIAHIVDLNSMRTALVRAGERLQRMVDALSESIETANGEDPVQLGAVENVLAAAERVQRFIDEEWPELVAGDPSKIAAIGAAIKRRVKEVFEPLESLADFLRAGPDAWARFRERRATDGAEAATTRTEGAVAVEDPGAATATTGDGVEAEGAATPDADTGADAAGTASAPDDGTGSVPTPRDPLPVVREGEIVKADDGGADGGGGDDSSTDVELNFSEDSGTETSEGATAPEEGAVAEPDPSATPPVENELAGPVATDEPPAEGPKRKTRR